MTWFYCWITGGHRDFFGLPSYQLEGTSLHEPLMKSEFFLVSLMKIYWEMKNQSVIPMFLYHGNDGCDFLVGILVHDSHPLKHCLFMANSNPIC